MKVSKYLDKEPTLELPGVLKREVINADDGAPNFCMRVFEVEFVLDGQGLAVNPQGQTIIAKDSVVFVPPDEHHCFINNSSDTLRFICVIPFAD